jgi:hypothetical protein
MDASGRVGARGGARGRGINGRDSVALLLRARGRVQPRLVASGRALRLCDQRDVSLHRYRRDQIFLSGERFDLPAIEIAARTIFLQAADRTRKSRVRVEFGNLVNRQHVFVFRRGRARARLGVGHALMITRLGCTARELSPSCEAEGQPRIYLILETSQIRFLQ